MYNMNLWETSGHAANYKENMFTFDVRVHGKLKSLVDPDTSACFSFEANFGLGYILLVSYECSLCRLRSRSSGSNL